MTLQPPPPSMPPPPGYGAPPTGYAAAPAQPYGVRFAGFWIRLVAYIIDSVIVGGIIFGLLVATKPITCLTSDGTTCLPGTTTISALFYVLVAIPLVYYILAWATGGTIGQRLLGLRVVSEATGKHLGLGRAILRFLGYILATAVIYIGLIWAAFDSRKQGWHDKIGGSLVIHK